MTENFDYLFQYLERESITIDKSEFLFQIQSHPDYPSLLSIADALSFLGIHNGAIRVFFTELELLPNNFITLLREKDTTPQLYFVEKKEESYFITKNKKRVEITKSLLQPRWQEIVLIIEKSETEIAKPKNNQFLSMVSMFGLILFVLTIQQFETLFSTKVFFILPLLGFLFSSAVLKDLFGTKSELLNQFCNITSSTSCSTVVGSKKWKIFELVNFSDLSIVFFSFQIIGLFLFILIGNSNVFLSLQEILLFFAIPVVFASLYFQKFVENKWCPICLLIIVIILLELFYLKVLVSVSFSFDLKTILLFGFVFIAVSLLWLNLKIIFTQNKELKEFQLKSNRFQRNYEVFKNSLLAKEKVELLKSPIILGNKDSKLIISIVTHPFCGYCKEAHEVLEKIIEKYGESLQVQIVFKVDIDNDNEKNKQFFRTLIAIYTETGSDKFRVALSNWFETKDIDSWLQKHQATINIENVDTILKTQNNWCYKENINFTPAIFINGYQYPDAYERENLEFFIIELIEDAVLH